MNIFLDIWHLCCQILQTKACQDSKAKLPQRRNAVQSLEPRTFSTAMWVAYPRNLGNKNSQRHWNWNWNWNQWVNRSHISQYSPAFMPNWAPPNLHPETYRYPNTPRARPVELLLMRRGLPKSKHLRNRSKQCSGGCYLVSARPTSRENHQKPGIFGSHRNFCFPKNPANIQNMQEWR